MNRLSRLRWALLILFSALFLVGAVMSLRLIRQSGKEQRAFEDLSALVETSVPAEGNAGDPSAHAASQPDEESKESGTPSPYLPLKQQNPDFYGWLYIEGTRIDYPVMYTPESPQYYLHRAFDGTSAYSGVPFRAEDCFDGGMNDLIYGHNMNNGTMFHDLLKYADEDFYREHPMVQFDTMEGSGRYEVLAAFYSEVYEKEEEGVFRYYQYTDLSDPEHYDEYLDRVEEVALYDTGVTAQFGDQLLTLTTCSYHTDNGRFVLVARRMEN